MEQLKQPISDPKPKLSLNNIRKKKKQNNYSNEEDEGVRDTLKESEESETLDSSFMQKLIADEDRFKETLVKLNDQAVQEIQNGNCNSGLQLLERLKKVLEYAAENGKLLDRNMIIVCLYNMACAYQMGWVLEKCAEYIDAVVYNLNQSIKQDDVLISSSAAELNSAQVTILTSIKIRKQRFLLKIYLQYCAVLSQLSKHEEALELAHKAQKIMISILSHCSNYCKDAREFLERDSQSQVNQDGSPSLNFDFYKNFDKSTTFYDEVPYLKHTLDFAIPFLNSFITTVKKFSVSKVEDTLKQTRKLLFNWKNNPENTEKYLRKEFGKVNFLRDKEDENRSILGLQTNPDWLQTLNIGSFMHMKPLKYKEYAEKRELISELTKESLQEKVVLQSLIYFSTATEIRFLRIEDTKNPKADPQPSEGQQISEAYHLTAIELVCKYISGACPYLNHLIASYQKHYNQNLEPIPEESFYSLSEDTFILKEKIEDKEARTTIGSSLYEGKKEKDTRKEKKVRTDVLDSEGIKIDQNVLRRGSENVLNSFKKEKSTGIIQRFKSAEKDKEKNYETSKAETEGRKNGILRNLDVRTKKPVKDGDEAKKIYENSLSSTSLTFGNVISKGIQSINTSMKSLNMNNSKTDSPPIENSDPKRLMKKKYEIPNLGLNKVLKGDQNKEKPSGIASDRGLQNRNDESSPKVRMSERKMLQKDQTQGGINFYLYKNFNKFIQNLYVKNGEQAKLRPKIIKQEKFTDNPYVKEISVTNTKKFSLNKSAASTNQSFKNNLTQSKLTSNTEPDEDFNLRRESFYEEEAQRHSSLTPRDESSDLLEIIEFNKKKLEQVGGLVNKSASTTTPKNGQNLDFQKAVQSKGKIKQLRSGDI